MVQKAHSQGNLYVWFDAEYSTVELETAALLQVAALITDASLRRVLPEARDVRLAIRTPAGTKFSPWVQQNLGDLLSACRSDEAVEIAEADERLAEYIEAATGLAAERTELLPVLAGNSIHFDWWLIRRFLPHFLSRLHYRQLDVSAFKLEWQRLHPDERFQKENPENVRAYFPEAGLIPSSNRHDAYYDLQSSIAELAFYRQHLFRS